MPRAKDDGTAQGNYDAAWLLMFTLGCPTILCGIFGDQQ